MKVPEIDLLFSTDKDDVLRNSGFGREDYIAISAPASAPKTFKFQTREVELFLLERIDVSEIVS